MKSNRILLMASLGLAMFGARAYAGEKVSKATAKDVLAACHTSMIGTAEEKFKGDNGVYATALAQLGGAGLIDEALASGICEGYRFTIAAVDTSFEVLATPTTQTQGYWTYALRGGGHLRRAWGKEPTDKDQKVSVSIDTVTANSDWVTTSLDVDHDKQVDVTALGTWQCGAGWQPSGPDGSGEKSGGVLVKGDNVRVGCLLVQIMGADGCYALRAGDKAMSFIAGASGKLQYRINCADSSGCTGKITTYAMITHQIDDPDKKTDGMEAAKAHTLTMAVVRGDNQSLPVGSLIGPVTVKVTDENGNPVIGAVIHLDAAFPNGRSQTMIVGSTTAEGLFTLSDAAPFGLRSGTGTYSIKLSATDPVVSNVVTVHATAY
jgi:hypothetical protein